jgi:hypothetical protein
MLFASDVGDSQIGFVVFRGQTLFTPLNTAMHLKQNTDYTMNMGLCFYGNFNDFINVCLLSDI